MERAIFGNLSSEGLEIVFRDDSYFVRYDAGAHQATWREDEISELEAMTIRSDRTAERETILALQRRLVAAGIDPYKQNWSPTTLGP